MLFSSKFLWRIRLWFLVHAPQKDILNIYNIYEYNDISLHVHVPQYFMLIILLHNFDETKPLYNYIHVRKSLA